MGLASSAFVLVLLISAREADCGRVLNANANHLMGGAASVLILVMLVVAVSTGQAMSI